MLLKCRIPVASFVLDIDVSFESKVASIFGPSGAGKTTLLDGIAGLRSIASGEIEIGGRVLFSSSSGVNPPPRQRCVGYVPQEIALFPHLTVRENITFGTGRRSSDRAGIRLEQVMAALEIGHLLNRSVTQLSGGECQRVALARAVMSRPCLLLLDEPLASLDIGLKERIIPYLRRVRDEFGLPMIYVTHSPTEVLSLADWVVVIKEGKLVTQGVPQDVLTSKLVLSRLEENQVENVLNVHLVDSNPQEGRSRVRLESGQHLFIPYTGAPQDRFLQVKVQADDIVVAINRPEGISAGNILPGTIESVETTDGQSMLRVNAGALFCVRLTTSAVKRLRLTEGQQVFLIIKTRSFLTL